MDFTKVDDDDENLPMATNVTLLSAYTKEHAAAFAAGSSASSSAGETKEESSRAVVPINNEEIPSAPPSDMDDIVPILDGTGNPLDMRDGTDTSCCTRCNYSCCNSLSCLWKESLAMYTFYGFVDLG